MALVLDPAAVRHLERVLAIGRERGPVPDAVSRRLGVESWMLTLDESGRLRAVTILGDQPAASLPGAPAASARHESPMASPLDRSYALPPAGALAHVIGGPTATGRQLADLALRRDDAEIRAEATRVVVDAAVREPALERTILDALAPAADAALAGALAGVAGDAAEGLVALVAERARGRPLGERAARVLAELRAR